MSKSKNPHLAIPAKGLMMAPLSPTSDLTTLSFSLPMASKLVGKGVSFLKLILGEELVVTWCQGVKVLSKLSQTNQSCFKSCLKPDSG